MILDGWKLTTIGALTEIDAKSLGKTTPDDFTFRYIALSDIHENHVRENLVRYRLSDAPLRARRIVRPGDLLIPTVRPSLQGFARITGAHSDCIASTGFTVLTTKPGTSSDYLFHYLFSKHIQDQIKATVTNANYPSINSSDIRHLWVKCPSLEQQQAIAHILNQWDRVILTTGELIKNSQWQKRALLQHLLSTHDASLGISNKWRYAELGDLAHIDAESLSKATPNDFRFRYITLSDISRHHVSESLATYQLSEAPSRARRIVRPGDLLMSTVRPNLQGFARVTRAHTDCIASTGFAVLTAKPEVSSDYLFHYLFSKHIQDQINTIMTGSSYPSINSNDIRRLLIKCPPLQQQQTIAEILNMADKRIKMEEQQRDLLMQQKQALMQQLLTGQRHVQTNRPL